MHPFNSLKQSSIAIPPPKIGEGFGDFDMRYRAARLVPCGGAYCFGLPLATSAVANDALFRVVPRRGSYRLAENVIVKV